MNYVKGLILALLLVFAAERVSSADIPKEVITWAESNVVSIVVGVGGSGSGFFVSPDTVVTACHVATGWESLYITHQGTRYLTTIDKCDAEADLALLKLEGELPDTVRTVIAKENPRVGKLTYGTGYPLGLPLTVFEGHWQKQGPNTASYINTTHTVPGDSGSALVIWEDGQVKVVGVRTGMYEAGPPGDKQVFPNLAFVEDVKALREFLSK